LYFNCFQLIFYCFNSCVLFVEHLPWFFVLLLAIAIGFYYIVGVFLFYILLLCFSSILACL